MTPLQQGQELMHHAVTGPCLAKPTPMTSRAARTKERYECAPGGLISGI